MYDCRFQCIRLVANSIVFMTVVTNVLATHFRGGIITWESNQNGEDPYLVYFTFKLAWRKSHLHFFCDDNTVSTSSLVGDDGAWNCVAGCSGTIKIGSTRIFCTSFSEVEDWTQGERSFNFSFPDEGPFTIRYASCCWIDGVVIKSSLDWSIQTTVDLSPRPDTNKINSSPISATSPIIRLQEGCHYNIPIDTDDPDGDEVRCRWSVGDECAGVCNALPTATLDESPCTIRFSANTSGWYAVAITLEDYPDPLVSTQPLSQVSLQFLIRVEDSGRPCESGLQFVSPTPVANDCINVPREGTLFLTIAVNASTGASLSEVILSAPLGVERSSIGVDGSRQHVNVSWTPTSDQQGSHIFCFSALDNFDVSTEQRCLTILVGTSAPAIVSGTQNPNDVDVDASSSLRKFSVEFDQTIRRPQESKFIRIWEIEEEGLDAEEFDSFDTSMDARVTITNRTLVFYITQATQRLRPSAIYYVTMERGAVVGLQSCAGSGAPSPAIVDPTVWRFRAVGFVEINPCLLNGGKGPCQQECTYFERQYHCSCFDGWQLSINEHSCFQPSRDGCVDDCNGNGVCLEGGRCDCQFGWLGESCSEAVCFNLGNCFGHGYCVAPNLCDCLAGWGGAACSVDLCSIHRSCQTCTDKIGCGWCDSSKKCLAGSGLGPDHPGEAAQCDSWLYYSCNAAVANKPSVEVCSDEVKAIDCGRQCIDNADQKTTGPGSYEYCTDFKHLCNNYARCFQSTETSDFLCPTWNEDECPFGIQGNPTRNDTRQERDDEAPYVKATAPSCKGNELVDVMKEKANGVDVVEETLRRLQESRIFPQDHGLMRRIAYVESKDGTDPDTFRDPEAEAGVGIWQMDKTTFDWPTASTTGFPNIREKYYPSIKKRFGVDMTTLQRRDLYRPLVAALVTRVFLLTIPKPIRASKSDQAAYWKTYYNTEAGNGTEKKFLDDIRTLERMQSEDSLAGDEGCRHGVRDPSSDCKCICEEDYTGPNCDQPDCGRCNPRPCSGNGVCEMSLSGKPRCRCFGRWEGDCCETCPPAPVFGDPHIRTIDGFEFDYFGIGTFWACLSRENDFGVELAFFPYEKTSLVGAAALKVGNGIVTVASIPDTTGSNRLAPVRIGGDLLTVEYGDEHVLAGGVVLYVNRPTNSSVIVSYFFKFSHGATYNIGVRYSVEMGRQYLEPAMGPPIAFKQKTAGLCGTMDDDATNDLVGPDGTVYADALVFAESWRVAASSSLSIGLWSWNTSNFHGNASLDGEYFDPDHEPQYDLSAYSSSQIQSARQICESRDVPESDVDVCVFDVVVTNDVNFAQQAAFQIGLCENDCSNHGDCVNGTCHCTGSWSGTDCSQGGCSSCPEHSRCMNGFCSCDFGYYDVNGTCVQASCAGVNNCTAPEFGRCLANDLCLCNPGFIGADCSQQAVCSHNCSNHGKCTDGDRCICDPNWTGDQCSIPSCEQLQGCLGNGNCTVNATCDCLPGWEGSNCGLASCSEVDDCSGNGQCFTPNQCVCDDGFAGANCSEVIACPSVLDCNSNGVCVDEMTCLCYDGFEGQTCAFAICSQGCSSQGQCVSPDFCQCDRGWTGSSCTEPSCEDNNYCSGNGDCIDYETCQCYSNWTGPACNVFTCTSTGNDSVACNGRGDCIGPGQCACRAGFNGSLCQIQVSPDGELCSKEWPEVNCTLYTPSCEVADNCSACGTFVQFWCVDECTDLVGSEFASCLPNVTWHPAIPVCQLARYVDLNAQDNSTEDPSAILITSTSAQGPDVFLVEHPNQLVTGATLENWDKMVIELRVPPGKLFHQQVSYERARALANNRLSSSEYVALGGSISETSGESNNDLGRQILTLTRLQPANLSHILLSLVYEQDSGEFDEETRLVILTVYFTNGCVTPDVTIPVRLIGENENSPIVTIDDRWASFVEGSGVAVSVTNGSLAVTDADNTFYQMKSAFVEIVGLNESAVSDERLSITVTSSYITVEEYDEQRGRLVLVGDASTEEYSRVLNGVQYINQAAEVGTSRTLLFSVSDGTNENGTNTTFITLINVNDAPVMTLSGGMSAAVTYREGDELTGVGEGIVISDSDDVYLDGAVVILCAAVEGDTVVPGRDLPANVTFKFISGGVNDSESLVNGISCRGETEHLYEMSGKASVAEYEMLLSSLQYGNIRPQPNFFRQVVKTIFMIVNDGDLFSTAIQINITFNPINDPPILQFNSSDDPNRFAPLASRRHSVIFLEDQDGPTFLFPNSTTLGDVDSRTTTMAVVQLTANDTNEELLWDDTVAVDVGIAVERNGTGLVLKGNVSFTAMREVLLTVQYVNRDDSEPSAGMAMVTVIVWDDEGAASLPVFINITVRTRNDEPVIDIGVGPNTDDNVTFTEITVGDNGVGIHISSRPHRIAVTDEEEERNYVSKMVVQLRASECGMLDADEFIYSLRPPNSRIKYDPAIDGKSITATTVGPVSVEDIDSVTRAYEELLFDIRYIHTGDEPTLYCTSQSHKTLERFVDTTIFDSGSPTKNTTITTRIIIESVNDNAPKLTVSVSDQCLLSLSDEDTRKPSGLAVLSSKKKRQVVFSQSSRNTTSAPRVVAVDTFGVTGERFSSGSVLTVQFSTDTNTPPVLRPRDLRRILSLSPSVLHRLPHFAVWVNAKTLTVVFPAIHEHEQTKGQLTVNFTKGQRDEQGDYVQICDVSGMICEESGTYTPNWETEMAEEMSSTDEKHRGDEEEQTQLYDWWVITASFVSISITAVVMVIASCMKKTARVDV